VHEPLAASDRRVLTDYARQTLVAVTAGLPVPPPPTRPALAVPASVFITLWQGDGLRGCVGDVTGRLPLGEAVGTMTRAAALEDPRFLPLEPNDAASVRIEISRLTPFRRARHDEIQVGRHGLLVRYSWRSGLLLPKVAVELGCDRAGFVELACRKAGLPVSAASDPALTVEIFEAEVFEE
jgi:AmmeMemoRadiSam system protein A